MAPLHRSIVASLPKRSTPSSLVALDGSYDFQTNRAEMGEKIAVFFRSKVGIPTTVIGLPETDRAGADRSSASVASVPPAPANASASAPDTASSSVSVAGSDSDDAPPATCALAAADVTSDDITPA